MNREELRLTGQPLLKNGNRRGDFRKAPRCGAQTRAGTLCQAPALRGKQRCRLHGGHSTGPKTVQGRLRIAQAHRVHGDRSKANIELRRQYAAQERRWKAALGEAMRTGTIRIP
jgi:hypothetical protein